MFPSSSRVKLNRASFKDVPGPEVVATPRRRKPTRPQESLGDRPPLHPEKVRETWTDSSSEAVLPVSTHLIKPSTRDVERNPAGCGDSDEDLREVVGTSNCNLCGEGTSPSPYRPTVRKQALKSCCPKCEPPAVECKKRKESAVTDTSKKLVIWINHYPKVLICDVAKICRQCSHKCGYILPDVLKTKNVTCFKRIMRTGFWFRPSCFGHNKQDRDEKAQVKNSECCPATQYGRSNSQSLTEHQKYPENYSDSQALSNHTTSCFHKRWRGDNSAASSDSLLPGKHINDGKSRAGMWERHVEDSYGSVCDPIGAEFQKEKRIKLNNGLGHSSDFGSDVDNFATETLSGWRADPAKTNGTRTPSEEEDEPESFTCQRVRVYLGKGHFSCARVYMPWPFVNSDPTLGALDSVTNCSAGPDNPSARNMAISEKANQNQPGSHGNQNKDMLQIKEAQQGNGHRNVKMTSHQDRKGKLRSPLSEQVEKTGVNLPSDTPLFSTPAWGGREPDTDAVSVSSLPVYGPETDSSRFTSSPSKLGLIDWKTALTLSPKSSPIAQGSPRSQSVTSSSLPFLSSQLSRVKGVCSQGVDKALFHSEETQITSFSSPSSTTTSSSDSNHPSDSTLLLLQHKDGEELCTDGNAPKCLYYNDTSTKTHSWAACEESSLLCNIPNEHCLTFDSTEWILPPMLSPINSPKRSSLRRNSGQEEDDDEIISINQNKMLHACHIPLIMNVYNEDTTNYVETGIKELDGLFDFKTLTNSNSGEPESSPRSDEDVDSPPEGDRKIKTNYDNDVEQADRSSEQEGMNPKLKTSLISGDMTDSHSSPSNDNDAAFSDMELTHSTDEMGSNSSIVSSNENNIQVEAPVDSQGSVLDEFAAFEQDILLVDVIQDDPELFNNPPAQTKLKLGPTRVVEAPKIKPNTRVALRSSTAKPASVTFGKKSTTVTGIFHCNNADIEDESSSRPWRPQCRPTPLATQHNKCPAPDKHPKYLAHLDANNNRINGDLERSQALNSLIPTLQSPGTDLRLTNSMNVTDYRRQKSNSYCRLYFGETQSCVFKICRFQHLPLEGDEKFCIESVARFTKNPVCLQKAGAVYTGYYQNNPTGVHFSMAVLLNLLWALLRAGMVIDVFSVLGVSLAHSVVPTHEFLLALFNFVREQGLAGFTPELIRLTFKMAKAGLELSLDCLDSVKNAPMFQQMVHSNSALSVSGNHMLLPVPEHLNLAHAILETELCIKQEDWRRMGEVFRSICQSNQHPLQVERVSGRITIALLVESKDKLSLPFVAFAETVCQNESAESPCRIFVGRIGVSLMLRYHKTHQWVKGRRVVEVLSSSKISYSILKSLFGNEDGASRCCLISVATEFFLLSGSVEGALKTLRENQWFLSSGSWPCEPADLESRTRVLVHLSEKTSLRDTLEVLCKLPGIKEPSDLMDMSRYSQLFSCHLQACVDRQILPVAAETVDFMLSNKLAVDQTLLQTLLHKLGRQNLWLRAREVFRHSLREGYYPGVSAPPGFRTLIVPCRLGEVELALAFEMFITVNNATLSNPAETSGLSVTLKRSQSSESEYLSAGSRLLSAACIPQPKLTVHYNAVNASQEQIFTLDIPSAQRWLRHNHLWAADIWIH